MVLWWEVIAVYPRWRGEHSDNSGKFVILTGLSPLARGTPTLNLCQSLHTRFIPAGAGNTDF
ncbi:hypothetical protein A464_2956 [Salmonella bongori N268-08]|uniref:Uncharacterized protein n=1 Tax=Salmonella bongori N268-08 TaxID=1197719 RepID=S5NBX1_SALBN|nr:hypothetical protein A464_2956 [Salmonella bongori N268-08]